MDERGFKRRLLLCPPDYYGVEYEINPWMSRAREPEPETAREQWNRLKQKLESLNCQVELLEPQKKLPDMVFTANAGLVMSNKFIRSNFRFSERRGEEPYFEKWFAERGFDVLRLPDAMFFEGEGDALFCNNALFCGYRFRSDIRSHQAVGEMLGTLAVSLELADDRYYHLDTCFCPLPDGTAIWYPAAFDEYGRRAVRHHVRELIAVEEQEAACFACNAVVLGKDIVLPEGCPKLSAILSERGYHPHALAMTEYLKAGGACKCLTLLVPQRE